MDNAPGPESSNSSTQRITSMAAQLSIGGSSLYPHTDVTELLGLAAKDMDVGQLIMDPKMDTGMDLDDVVSRPQYDINRLVNPTEIIWILDNILVGQMTWLSGHALSQTLFTSCYVLRVFEIDLDIPMESSQQPGTLPTQFTTLVLKACVLSIAKTCGVIWGEMKKGHTYEEEDFMTNRFGISFYENYPSASTIALLDQAEYWMETEGSDWIRSEYKADSDAVIRGIMARIGYARATRDFVRDMTTSHSLGHEVESAFDHAIHRKLVTNTPPRAIALLTIKETFEQLDQMCTDLLSIGRALQFNGPTTLLNFFIRFGSQKPMPGAFPRSILQSVLYEDRVIMGSRPVQFLIHDIFREIISPPEWIFENFVTLQNQLERAENLEPQIDPESLDDGLAVLQNQIQAKAVYFIEKAIKPFVDTLQIMGQNSSRQRRNLRKIVLLWESLQEEAELLDVEIHQVVDELNSAYQTTSAEDAPRPLQPFYFVSWVYHMKLWVLEWFLLLGSELELYSTFENSMIYAYADCVLGAHSQHLRRIQLIMENDEMLSKATKQQKQASSAQKKKKKKKKKATGTASASDKTEQDSNAEPLDTTTVNPLSTFSQQTPAPSQQSTTQPIPGVDVYAPSILYNPRSDLTPMIQIQQMMVSTRMNLARGTFLMLAALTKAGHLTATPPHLEIHGLNDLRTLFAHRFKVFQNLSSPEVVTFEDFQSRLDCEGVDAMDILGYAIDFYNEAKSSLDRLQALSVENAREELCEETWRKDIKDMIKVCIASKIAATGLQKDERILEQKKNSLESKKRAEKPVPGRPIGKAKAGVATTKPKSL
ncbi:hypothetical protein BGW38_008813, partial [Lunasporangiospora selenospora]